LVGFFVHPDRCLPTAAVTNSVEPKPESESKPEPYSESDSSCDLHANSVHAHEAGGTIAVTLTAAGHRAQPVKLHLNGRQSYVVLPVQHVDRREGNGIPDRMPPTN